MATRAQKVRLSIFLFASGGLLLLLLLLLAGNRLFSRRDSYEIEFRHTSVSGLETGAPVKYHGVQVGRVVDLRVTDPTSVFISIQVRHGTPIMRDTRAVLTLLGITGLKFIELQGGTEESGLLAEGGTILAGQSVFDAISGRAEDVMVKVELMLNSLNRLLSPETTDAVERTVVSLAAAAEQAEILLSGGRVPAGAARIDTILTRFASVSQNLDETMREISELVRSPDVDASIGNVRHVTERFRTQVDSMEMAAALAEFRSLIRDSNQMVVHSDLLVVQARHDVLRSLTSLEEALENLREATEIIRDNPAVLIRGRQASQDRMD